MVHFPSVCVCASSSSGTGGTAAGTEIAKLPLIKLKLLFRHRGALFASSNQLKDVNNGEVNLKQYLFLDDLKQKRKKEIICEIFGTGKSMIPNPVLHDLPIPLRSA